MRKSSAIVIGAGFSGLSAAANLAAKGVDVTVLEKNETVGGRASVFESDGFVFDMGPSWYWMPEVFENFYNSFGYKTVDFYELNRLDPSYAIYFGKDHCMQIPADMDAIKAMFETYEPGSSKTLEQFLAEAKYKYEVGLKEFVYKPGHSIFEFADIRLLKSAFKLKLFTSIGKQIKTKFKNPFLRQLLEFPVLFLGATPDNTPSLYSLMNYADMQLGTWYPLGGMYKITEAFEKIAQNLGVKIHRGEAVTELLVDGKLLTTAKTKAQNFQGDVYIASADYHHVEQKLLPPKARMYSPAYWDKRTMAPSSLLFYIGVNKRLTGLRHHTLFFDEDFTKHAYDIYEHPKWPEKPLFYVCAPSITDPTVAPAGCENLFILIPLAADLPDDSDEMREQYYNLVMERLENLTGQTIRNHVVFKRSFGHTDFMQHYNAFKGNAYGLANTLLQTAFLKPKMKNTRLKNLYYTGQMTTPGPGVPPSIISGEVVAREALKYLNSN